jgi:peptide/nickel transport system permease protein
MLRIISQRLLTVVPTALIGSLIIFAIVQLAPGGPAAALLGPEVDVEVIQRVTREMGLDQPVYVQFGKWAWHILGGDFGRSLMTREPVIRVILDRLPVTATLAGEALVLSLLVGVPLGILAAVRRGSNLDTAVKTLSGLTHAFPEFWIGMLAMSIFALQLGWFPATGFASISDGLVPHLHSAALPAITLAIGPLAVIVRFTRSAMVEALGGTYVRTAWALGLPPRQVYWRFALKNALIPIVTVIGLVAGTLIGGAVLVERVFAIPGLGDLLAESVLQKDYPVVQGVTVVLMGAIILINLTVDVLCAVLDPRTRTA